MPGIHLFSSNRLEVLADIFADLIKAEPLPPFRQETVILQSRGMERWLALETASRLNIWANCSCPFPNTFVRNIYKLLLPDLSEVSRYDKEYILWDLMHIIPPLMHHGHFARIASYLASGDDLKLYQLSYEIADLFEQYTLFRPDMILDWENTASQVPTDHAWQSRLWVSLNEHLQRNQTHPEHHRARLLQLFEEKISDPAFDHTLLPPRVSVFGISSLPPYHLKILAALAQHIDLYFFIMNPCREYWFDIVADRDIVKISRREALSQDRLHFRQGNSLLASMGHLGRDFMALLQDVYAEEHEFFQDPDGNTLLSKIQHDILSLREYPGTSDDTGHLRHTITADDVSLTFHSCHSPMRELEILHDLLLEIFADADADDPIEPRDILVMAPEINTYAPLIRAVFEAPASDRRKIPYGISDQSIRGTSKYIDTFFKILLLEQSRFSSIDLMGILEAEAVKNRFCINDRDIPTIKHWVQQTRICWGINQEHKADLQLPPYPENTWKAGLDRLLLGYAMEGHGQILFENILPYDDIEGNDTYLLGSFLDFSATVFNLAELLQSSYSLREWSEILLQVKDKLMLADAETEAEDRILHRMLYKLQELQEETAFVKKVSLGVIRSYLLHSLDERFSSITGQTGFLAGGITFCSMLPMRAIPFKVICLLGMNDGEYPRTGRKKSFDLMARKPRRGDRSKRYDDRYLFLETILSARIRLMISFVGQSIQDGTRRPPSVLVSELMDYIDQGYSRGDNRGKPTISMSEGLTTMHHLQPFHPDYFMPSATGGRQKLFSYSAENYEAALALAAGHRESKQIFTTQMSPSPAALKQVDLQELIRFFSHPGRYLLVNIMDIAPIEESQVLETSERFTMQGLTRYALGNDILEHLLQNRDCNKLYQLKKAAGELPHGTLGEIYFTRMVAELRSFHKTLTELFDGQEPKSQETALALGDLTVTARLDALSPKGLVLHRYGDLKSKDVIRSWITHLVFHSLHDSLAPEYGTSTYFAGRNNIYRYRPTADWKLYLEQLLDLYRQGITSPLHFFPQTSFVFAEEFHKDKNEQKALRKAVIAWEGDDFNSRGEKNNPYNRLCWGNEGTLSPTFRQLAKTVFLPALAHQEKI